MEKFYPQDQLALSVASSLKDIFKRARREKCDWLADKLSDAEAGEQAEALEKELDQLVEPKIENLDAAKCAKDLSSIEM